MFHSSTIERGCAVLVLSLGVALGTVHAERPSTFIPNIWSPEDLLQLPASPWIVVSAMRSELSHGGLRLVDSRDSQRVVPLELDPQPWAPAFAPHGIAARSIGQGRVELLVVDHGGGEFVDRLVLALAGDAAPTLTSASRLALPEGVSANGIAPLGDGFVIASMFDPKDRTFLEKFSRAEPTGAVWRWTAAGGFKRASALPFSGANGIAVSRDGTTLFVSEWATSKLWRIPLNDAKPTVVQMSFHPDNLRWTARGDLLVAGQLGDARELFACKPGGACSVGYVVARIDPKSLAVHPLLTVDSAAAAADGFGGVTGAIEIGRTLWLGTYTGDRIARIPLRSP